MIKKLISDGLKLFRGLFGNLNRLVNTRLLTLYNLEL